MKELKILQRNYQEFDYRINEGYNPPSFEECQVYLARQSRLLKRLGTKIETHITDSGDPVAIYGRGSNNELGYYDLIEDFDRQMLCYKDPEFLKSVVWRVMPKLTVDSNHYQLISRRYEP